jgi:hypothetical protein
VKKKADSTRGAQNGRPSDAFQAQIPRKGFAELLVAPSATDAADPETNEAVSPAEWSRSRVRETALAVVRPSAPLDLADSCPTAL